MKYLLVLVALCGISLGQTPRKITVDWEACKVIQKEFQPRIDKFNERKDGLHLDLMCVFAGNPEYKKIPEKRVPLKSKEVRTLRQLREFSRKADTAQSAYEDYLISVHQVRKLKIEESCFFFVGIIYNTDYITIDPNPMDPLCRN